MEDNTTMEEVEGSNVTVEEKPNQAPAKKKTDQSKKPKREFPHQPIEESRKIADAIKQYNAGNPWAPKDIASALEMGGGNNFYYLTAASRDYGITIGTREAEKIEISDLGKRLVYPKTPQEEADAVLEAFRSVELFKKVYDYYQGENLPDIQYLKNTLKTEFNVDEPLQDEFHSIYQKNLAYLKSKAQTTPPIPSTSENKIKSTSIILGESSAAGKLVAFVAMPFSEKTSAYPKGYFDEVLKHLITPAAVKANFNARTAKKAGSEVIQSTIVNDLDAADLVIVDLTEHNPNVLFELGMRIAFNKPVCLIRAKGTPAIFDIDHMLRVYDYNPCLWPSTLEIDIPALTDHITETWKLKDKDRSYLSILRENK
jgi:hypothetical protein